MPNRTGFRCSLSVSEKVSLGLIGIVLLILEHYLR
jgi:hypothetical protein